ncbi:MAG: hypothetical protein N3D11_10440 [Candidatus Sumerlaeia bacterium]|nr:hypothetical protein [Candidatus Sumerlaeia bacterium]
MKHPPQRVLEILLDELARALHLTPEQTARCRILLADALMPRRPALFLATGERPLTDPVVEAFRTLTALGVRATLVRSHSFAQVWTSEVLRARLGTVALLDDLPTEEICALPDRFPLLCILALSDNTAMKSVLGLRDAVPPQIVRTFLERGRPVVAAGNPPQRSAVEERAAAFWELPLAVRQWLAESYRTLEQWGVEFVEAERLAETVKQRLFGGPQRPAGSNIQTVGSTPDSQTEVEAAPTWARDPRVPHFITVDDIRAARHRGERQMRIAPNMRVTDEAREAARRWGILLLE